ncbi:MAG: hypothetical protein OXI83_06680, partial [Gemmatimonadota bacterium]|nr:hypothetical protein [Gemmatimonadota bacterium]
MWHICGQRTAKKPRPPEGPTTPLDRGRPFRTGGLAGSAGHKVTRPPIEQLLADRILVLDGAMGTMIQR